MEAKLGKTKVGVSSAAVAAPAAAAAAPAAAAGAKRPQVVVSTGNHQRYYGYRSRERGIEDPGGGGGRINGGEDPRLSLLRRDWFEGRKVKDVGCNAGQFTALIAKEFAPRFMLGVDADLVLVKKAQTACDFSARARSRETREAGKRARAAGGAGVLALGPLPFPHNLWFQAEEAATAEAPAVDHSYDTVCAFSVTKWIHLNHGDEGLTRFFRRTFDDLKPGGRFIFEPQPLKSYKKRKKASATTLKHYEAMKIKPNDFPKFLVDKIGFEDCVLVGTPDAPGLSEGFKRPIYCATKPLGVAAAAARDAARLDAATDEPKAKKSKLTEE
ncbi:Bicoid-interacting protein 3-domain-containing protein [Pelagophyceae sp. CCMP2097]|nr:Bicoid-interacting protein 3-domain-containing protein [Pelagophyceae sp. CCMP2097]